MAEALDEDSPPQTVADIVHPVTNVGVDDPPPRILSALGGHGGTGLPVVNRDKTALVGWITYETVLRADASRRIVIFIQQHPR